MKRMPLVEMIMDYEAGDLDLDETVEFFGWLIESGVINHLQGHYQRTAADLMQAGLLREPEGEESES